MEENKNTEHTEQVEIPKSIEVLKLEGILAARDEELESIRKELRALQIIADSYKDDLDSKDNQIKEYEDLIGATGPVRMLKTDNGNYPLYSHSQLEADVQLYLANFQQEKMKAIADLFSDTSISIEEKLARNAQILSETLPTKEGLIRKLKTFYIFDGKIYESGLNLATVTTRPVSTSTGTTKKATSRFNVGDQVQYTANGLTSEVFVVTESYKIRPLAGGDEVNPSLIVCNMHDKAPGSMPGLSDKRWTKI